jgi:YggT family protein
MSTMSPSIIVRLLLLSILYLTVQVGTIDAFSFNKRSSSILVNGKITPGLNNNNNNNNRRAAIVQQHYYDYTNKLNANKRTCKSSSSLSLRMLVVDNVDGILSSSFDNNINNMMISNTISSTSIVLAQTEAWVQPVSLILDPILNFMSFAMLARVVISWYPEMTIKDAPWSAIVVFPTDPLLRLVKGIVPPAFGVDITPVFWLAIFTFLHEIFLGQQGLLTLKLKYGI